MSADTLSIWTIYESPADFPGRFVVRRFEIVPGNEEPQAREVHHCGSLDTARKICQYQAKHALMPMPRADSDPPSVVESWI